MMAVSVPAGANSSGRQLFDKVKIQQCLFEKNSEGDFFRRAGFGTGRAVETISKKQILPVFLVFLIAKEL